MTTPLPRVLRLQSVLYNTEVDSLKRAYLCAVNAIENAVAGGLIDSATFAYGDCSPEPLLTQDIVDDWAAQASSKITVPISLTYFNANLGSAAGHNALMSAVADETRAKGGNRLLAIINPDVKMAGDALQHLIATLTRPGVGLVEARQLPIEHPKDYDEETGKTLWASTATALTTTDIYWQVDGFDAATFFLYCDDVDFSWKIREQGLDCIFQPAAVIFHDKRLNPDGSWPAGPAEQYYSAEAALLLTYKWSRPDLTEKYIQRFLASGRPYFLRAAESFAQRKAEGRLPVPRDSSHEIGQFVRFGYAPHRF